MSIRADQPPTPFPTRTFAVLGTSWVLVDLVLVLTIVAAVWSSRPPFFLGQPWAEALFIAWQASLAAKAMLMLGWFFLGEGSVRQRLSGLFLFAPVIAPFVIGVLWAPEALCAVALMGFFGVPVCFIVALPYAVLKGTDHRLARDAPASEEKLGQFTVRQLLLVTLAAAIVLGLLRWAQQANLQWGVVGVQMPLLIWVFPFVMCRGMLLPRWYPDILIALGVMAFVLALPAFALSREEVGPVALFVGVYVAVFTAHLFLLRAVGFRLVQYKPRFRYDPGIWFVDREEPGIEFLERHKSR